MPFSAAPKGAWPSLQGVRYYKHGAPNGAGNISVAEDTYKVQSKAGCEAELEFNGVAVVLVGP